MPQTLSVLLNRTPVGTLTFNGREDHYGFEYHRSWLEKKKYCISPHVLPQENDSGKIKRFLSNLLPEGKWLEELSVNNQVSKSNIFGLIALLGTETAGALSFHLERGEEFFSDTDFREIAPAELKERITQRDKVSIARWDGKERLSIAGVQEKLPLIVKPDGQYGFGEGRLASTHIMKFGTHDDTHLVINEFLCMKLAAMAGIPAAEVSLTYFDEPVLLVERFDRQWKGASVDRLHLIDGCQILDLPPVYKYERPFGSKGEAGSIRTGASLPKLFKATDLCRVPARARMDLLNRVLLQLIIGNCDAHGKNISFIVRKKGIDIAPAYDILNVDIYGDMFDRELAMAVGDEFSLERINAFQLAEFCEECGLQQRMVSNTFIKLCDAVSASLKKLNIDVIRRNNEKDFAVEMLKNISARAQYFRNISRKLPGIVL